MMVIGVVFRENVGDVLLPSFIGVVFISVHVQLVETVVLLWIPGAVTGMTT